MAAELFNEIAQEAGLAAQKLSKIVAIMDELQGWAPDETGLKFSYTFEYNSSCKDYLLIGKYARKSPSSAVPHIVIMYNEKSSRELGGERFDFLAGAIPSEETTAAVLTRLSQKNLSGITEELTIGLLKASVKEHFSDHPRFRKAIQEGVDKVVRDIKPGSSFVP